MNAQITETQRNNKVAMICHCVTVSLMVLFFSYQSMQGTRPWWNVAVGLVLGMSAIIGEFIVYRKNKSSKIIKHFVGFGFAIFFTYMFFMSNTPLYFVFSIPMIFIVSVYNDTVYSLAVSGGVIIEVIITAVIGSKTLRYGYIGMEGAALQVVLSTLICVYSLLTTKTLQKNSEQKVENVNQAKEQTENVLENISNMTLVARESVEKINVDLERLLEASNVTREAMNEVTSGTTDTAEAVQEQIMQTDVIQEKILLVDGAVESIMKSMSDADRAMEYGNKNIQKLVSDVEKSVQNGEEVAEKLKTLDGYMKEMNSIVELISGITSQTSLLALNASIEAARAGEAGKGFAVVATEINAMATQTDEATESITALIKNVSEAISEVVQVIYQMIAGINEEKTGAESATESLGYIKTSNEYIQNNVDKLTASVDELKEANRVIVDSIQTISAISEEVSAHATQTAQAEEDNTEILGSITKQMEELNAVMNNN